MIAPNRSVPYKTNLTHDALGIMSSIDTKLKALEYDVQQIRNALRSADTHSSHANRRGPRRSIRLQDSKATPSLLEEVPHKA